MARILEIPAIFFTLGSVGDEFRRGGCLYRLHTADFAAATEFYAAVFGWQLQAEADSDEFRYSTAVFDGIPLIGVMDGSVIPGLANSTWNCFWGSDDVDATIEAITANGGSVVRAAEDTPLRPTGRHHRPDRGRVQPAGLKLSAAECAEDDENSADSRHLLHLGGCPVSNVLSSSRCGPTR